jgi:hypothetical protein
MKHEWWQQLIDEINQLHYIEILSSSQIQAILFHRNFWFLDVLRFSLILEFFIKERKCSKNVCNLDVMHYKFKIFFKECTLTLNKVWKYFSSHCWW